MHDDSSTSTDDNTTTGDTPADVPADPRPLFGSRPEPDGGHIAELGADHGATTAIPTVTGTRRTDRPADDVDRDATGPVPTTTAPGTSTEAPAGAAATPPADHDRFVTDDGGRGRSSAWRWAAVPLVLLVVALAWVGWLFNERAGMAMPGVTVEGFDASGLTGDQITDRLQSIVATRREAPVTVTAGDQEYVFQLGAEGYRADVAGTVDQALSSGRDGLVGSAVTHVQASMGDTSWTIPLAGVDVDQDVDDFLARIAADIGLEPTAGGVAIDAETLEVTTEVPQQGFEADTEAIRDDLTTTLGIGEPGDLTVPVETLPPKVEPANVEAVAQRATDVLAESYVLAAADDALTIDPSEIAPLLSIQDATNGYRVAIDRGGVVELLSDGRGDRFAVSPESASYEVVSGTTTFDDKGSTTFDPVPARVDLIEGRNGREFNPEVGADLLVELFRNGEHRGEFDLDVVEASFTNAEAEAAQPDALLGTFTTYHDAGGARVFNIHLLADMIDGEVLPPGDDFSVNRDIGDRTEEKGFKPAGAIQEGEIIDDDVGGGVSQLATTFYNAAFFAGIDVLSWKPHSLPIDRYPLAREATFSYSADLDIHILNNTEGGLVVTTSYTSTSITVNVYGQDDGRRVQAIMGEPHDYTDFEVVRRTTDEIPDGQTRTVQEGGEGFTVDYQRVIKGGNNAATQDYSWAYSPKPTIIETGTG